MPLKVPPIVHLGLWVTLFPWILSCSAFLVRPSIPSKDDRVSYPTTRLPYSTSPATPSSHNNNNNNIINGSDDRWAVDVVLFGVGDLRVDDHLGLRNAIQRQAEGVTSDTSPSTIQGHGILPLVLLDRETLTRIPGAIAHTQDTAALVQVALSDLQQNLWEQFQLPLQVRWTLSSSSWIESIQTAVEEYMSIMPIAETMDSTKSIKPSIRIHVCDLGPADNEMRYGPFSIIQEEMTLTQPGGETLWELLPWTNNLRSEPWTPTCVSNLSQFFPEYESMYLSQSPDKPVGVSDLQKLASALTIATKESSSSPMQLSISPIPSTDELVQAIMQHARLDAARVKAEVGTGLYGTHWGGLPAETVAGSQILEILRCYASDCQEDDTIWERHPRYIGRSCRRTGRSLEHAAMTWQLRGDGKFPAGNPLNWLAGESMIRALAAPLLLGTVSPRRIWHTSTPNAIRFFFTSPLQRLVEGREWHRLLAARNIQCDPAYRASCPTMYKYWRYHGFLCRYVQTDFTTATSTPALDNKEGILLIHGFGASGAQWNKAMNELSHLCADSQYSYQGIAPDLIGFGQSEKPAISYTGYMWDSMTMDFVKEIAIQRHNWTSYVVGGNSIGGYTALSLAASDSATVSGQEVSSNGAPGTNICTGLVLMNSAGPVLSPADVARTEEAIQGQRRSSVAQLTITDALPPCNPPFRPLGRVFGNGLLLYLRPRIQSICKNLYPTNPGAVDETLCRAIERDSLDPGAINVMMAGAKLPPPRTANELLMADFGAAPEPIGSLPESTFTGQVLVAQGILDPLNDSNGRMVNLGQLRRGITTDPIEAGHCPHDEQPGKVANSIASWMRTTTLTRAARLRSDGTMTKVSS